MYKRQSDYSAKIARETQKYLQSETDLTNYIDPFAGSEYVEYLTDMLYQKAKKHITEINEHGGIVKAIEKGIPKLRIEEAATKRQAKIDSGDIKILGVNFYAPEDEEPIDTLQVDNKKVREDQISRIEKLKKERDEEVVQSSLSKLNEVAKTGKGNLLEIAIECAKNRATLGEISMAMEKEFGRYKAPNRLVSGVYNKAMENNELVKQARTKTDNFAEKFGRRPRILIAKLGQDGHDRGAKVVATSFADIGFDVDIGPLFQTPQEAVKQAMENDVHILGISSLAAGHKELVPETIQALKDIGRSNIMVVVGGVIPRKDYDFLFEAGVAAVFGPGTNIAEAAIDLLELFG